MSKKNFTIFFILLFFTFLFLLSCRENPDLKFIYIDPPSTKFILDNIVNINNINKYNIDLTASNNYGIRIAIIYNFSKTLCILLINKADYNNISLLNISTIISPDYQFFGTSGILGTGFNHYEISLSYYHPLLSNYIYITTPCLLLEKGSSIIHDSNIIKDNKLLYRNIELNVRHFGITCLSIKDRYQTELSLNENATTNIHCIISFIDILNTNKHLIVFATPKSDIQDFDKSAFTNFLNDINY